MNNIKVGDTIRNKKTGVVCTVISDSSYANMYRIDTGSIVYGLIILMLRKLRW